jgi:type IV pilus assembly protein PilW
MEPVTTRAAPAKAASPRCLNSDGASSARTRRRPERVFAQRGLTIIELMVSVALSLAVLSALIYVYVGSRGAYRGSEAVARVQENGRFAIDWLAREIRSAGFYGCASRGPVPVIIAADFTGFAMGLQAVAGVENGAGWTAPGGVPRVRGDVLLLSGMSGSPAGILDSDPNAAGASRHIDKCIGLKHHDLVMATNCARSTIVRVTNQPENGSCPPGPGGNEVTDADHIDHPDFRLDPPYLKSSRAMLLKFAAFAYFIGQNPAGAPALYRTSLDPIGNDPTEEVVDNIEDLDLLFGEDTDGDGSVDTYRSAAQVIDWRNVLSVRITLIAVGPESGATNRPQSYYFGADDGGTAVAWDTKNDLRLRQVFTSTVAIRNKLP